VKIKSATVILTSAADEVLLDTDLPAAMPVLVGEPIPLTLSFLAEKDTGIAYVENHFGIRPRTVSRRF
jgi:hypothetical protein